MQNLCDAVAITLSGIYIDVLSVLAHVQSHDRMIVIVTDLPRPSFGSSWESVLDKVAMMMIAAAAGAAIGKMEKSFWLCIKYLLTRARHLKINSKEW